MIIVRVVKKRKPTCKAQWLGDKQQVKFNADKWSDTYGERQLSLYIQSDEFWAGIPFLSETQELL